MMTKNRFTKKTIMNLLIAVPLSAALIIGFISCSGIKKARSGKQAPSEIFVVVEEMPIYPGGDSALMSFITKNINYPVQAKQKGIQGRVILRFSVNHDGTVGNAMVLKSADPSLDAEALRIVNLMPKWQPGKQGGKPVNVWYAVPITFALK
jgi:periplasmic protein TonB